MNNSEGCWISLILRLAMISLFAVVGIHKFIDGIDGVVMYFESTFKETWLPLVPVKIYGRLLAYIEVLIALWLLTGIRLRAAWVFTALVLVTLFFGMAVAKQYGTAANNMLYIVVACLGIYFSQFDRIRIDRLRLKRKK